MAVRAFRELSISAGFQDAYDSAPVWVQDLVNELWWQLQVEPTMPMQPIASRSYVVVLRSPDLTQWVDRVAVFEESSDSRVVEFLLLI